MYANLWLDSVAGECRKIGLYCGSFNPIHVGHTSLASYIVEHTDIQRVWLVVSPQNPLKKREDLMDDDFRLALARMATEDISNVDVSDVEMQLPIPSYTIDTLRHLSDKYPAVEFSLIIGADNVAVFDKWRDYEEILLKYRVIVYPRPGFDARELMERYPSMEFVDAPLYDVSSTEIRNKLAQGESISGLVHPLVQQWLTRGDKARP